MLRILVLAAILIGSPICCHAKLDFDDPRLSPEVAAAFSAAECDFHPHIRVAAAAADEAPPHAPAYHPEPVREDEAPRTKFVFDDYDTYQRNELKYSKYAQDERLSHDHNDKNEVAAIAEALEPPPAVPALSQLDKYRMPSRQDSRNEQSPDHFDSEDRAKMNRGRYVKDDGVVHELGDRKEYPVVADAHEPEGRAPVVRESHERQVYPVGNDAHEPEAHERQAYPVVAKVPAPAAYDGISTETQFVVHMPESVIQEDIKPDSHSEAHAEP
ncbi:hypothetical protein IWW38_005989, partial [Coemansia aciculifera]